MKKVAIIGTAGVPARYGGFETLAHNLVKELNHQFDLSVYCSNTYYKKEERVRYWNNARLFHLPFNANGAQSIIYDIISILHALLYADTLIILGVSGGMIVPLVKLFTNKKIIINIDGLEWRRQKWNKYIKKFLKASEILAVRYSDADITDNAAIKRYTAINYKTLSHLIEYGADHAKPEPINEKDKEKYPFLKNPYAFKVCRIEPENNVHVILEAFSNVPKQTLVFIGNWAKSEYGISLKEKFEKYSNLHLLDPIYDQKQLDKLRSNCQVYVHGHSAGGTNPSLVEAMFLKLPVIAFDVSYNRATTENLAFFFKNEEHLIQLLQTKTHADYETNKAEMKTIANRRYTWNIIAKRYANLVHSFDHAYQKKSIFSRYSKISYHKLENNGLAHLKSPVHFYEEEQTQ